MKKGTKLSIALTGVLLIALGVLIICKPVSTMLTSSWIIGLILLCSGISTFAVWSRVHSWMVRSSSLLFSSIFQIILGIICFDHSLAVAVTIPVIFAIWLIVEGINLTIQSFDFRKVGFGGWWAMLLLGIAALVLGVSCLHDPIATGKTLAIILGVGVCLLGLFYLLGFCGIEKFEKNARRFLEF